MHPTVYHLSPSYDSGYNTDRGRTFTIVQPYLPRRRTGLLYPISAMSLCGQLMLLYYTAVYSVYCIVWVM